jgi:hypothetical protein
MTALIATRPKPLSYRLNGSVPARTWDEPTRSGKTAATAGAAAEQAYLAVVVTSAGEYGEPAFAKWRADQKLAECSRALPLAWPMAEWLDDYRDLLATALADKKIALRSAWWTGAIRAFLQLMLDGQDKSAADFLRALTRLHPFADETRRVRRVQALFASIRPALSLTEALGFRIVTRWDASR